MANTDLASLIAHPNSSNPTQWGSGMSPDDEVKLEAILSIAELIEKGTRSTTVIMEWLAGQNLPHSRPTAIKYRNLAITLIQRENKPLNREAWRAMEQGRLTYWIERLTNKIHEFEESQPSRAHEDYLKWHETYAKLLSKLNDLSARFHAITGLNEITINSNDKPKRIIFKLEGPVSHNTPTPRHAGPIIEGQAIPTPPTH